MAIKYVEVVFASSSKRYTYHTELDLQVNDHATVLTADGVTPVQVVAILKQAPAFKTKPIHALRGRPGSI
ncbi:hypothetical protein [Achromobacter phage SE2]|nr:hypothetical protein [Achromobacter phage SE2]